MKSIFARLMLQKKYIFLILRVNIRDFFRADYLKRKGSEVVNMLTAEYDYETDIEVQRGEAYDEGREEGKLEGKLEERKNLTKKLYEEKFTVAEISKLLKMKEDEVKEIINY
jgi:predicted transposase YdaD